MSSRPELHPNGVTGRFSKACYTLDKNGRQVIFKWFKDVKFSYGFENGSVCWHVQIENVWHEEPWLSCIHATSDTCCIQRLVTTGRVGSFDWDQSIFCGPNCAECKTKWYDASKWIYHLRYVQVRKDFPIQFIWLNGTFMYTSLELSETGGIFVMKELSDPLEQILVLRSCMTGK